MYIVQKNTVDSRVHDVFTPFNTAIEPSPGGRETLLEKQII
jgi:hypothetical protein